MLKQLKNILPSIRLTQIPLYKLGGSIALPLSRSFSSSSGNNGSGKESAKLKSWMSTLGETDKERIRYIRNEISLFMLEGKTSFGPDDVTISEFSQLLALSSNQRKSFYRAMRKTKLSQKSEKQKSEIRKENIRNNMLQVADNAYEPKHIEYGLGKCGLIPKVYGRTIHKWDNLRVFGAIARDEPKLIFDCGFDREIAARDVADTAKQLILGFGANRMHRMPFVMHLCNLDQNGLLWRYLTKDMPNLGSLEQPIQVHEEDYCDLFPKENIVLLTSQSPHPLKTYDPTKHYVLGGYINRSTSAPFLMAKAKKQELETARIPIDLYRTLQRNYNTLPLNQMVKILLEVKYSRDWDKAFDYIARRFVR